jgi:hypothetical protein
MMILIEVKKEGEKQTPLQEVTMNDWVRSGAIGMVATKLEHIKGMMEKIMKERINLIEEGKI